MAEAAASGGARRAAWIARGALLLLCLLQFLPLLQGRGPATREPRTDAYYVRKSEALVRTGSFEKPTERDLAVLRGDAPGQSDFRPPGYPVFLALLGVTGENWHGRDRLVAAVQLLAVFACLGWILERAIGALPPRGGIVAAVVLGVQPWTAEFAYHRAPDTLNAAIVFAGAVLAARAATAGSPGRRTALAAASAAALAVCSFLRPEMLAFAPLVPGAGLWVLARREGRRAAAVPALAAALVLAAAVGGHAAYRWTVFGERAVVGRFQPNAPGVARWLKTWTSTDGDLRGIRNVLVSGGRVRFDRIPDRAFADDREREAVRAIVEDVARRGEYLPEHDGAFDRIAGDRVRADPLANLVGTRLWSASALLLVPGHAVSPHAAKDLPPPVKRPIAWGLIGLRILVLGAAAVAMGRVLRRPPGAGATAVDVVVLAGAAVAIVRVAWLGLGRGVLEHRYAVLLWPFLLLAAVAWLAQSPRSRWLGTRERSVDRTA